MKNLIIPAAIAASSFFVVSTMHTSQCDKNEHPVYGKVDAGRHHRHVSSVANTVSTSETPSKSVQVAYFTPLAEIAASSFFIDFSDAQTDVADLEIGHQMEAEQVKISIPATALADFEISSHMDENLVEIILPGTEKADAEINANFDAK